MKIGRRSFLIKLSLVITGLIGLIALDGFWFEKYIIDWTEFDISEGKKNKIKIIQLSDLHIQELKSFHKSIASRINKEQPDVIVFTGDSVTRTSRLRVLEQLLMLIDPKYLKIAILGNKEHDGKIPIEDLNSLFKKYNGLVLVNENYTLKKGNREINIIGLDDFMTGKADFEKAAAHIDPVKDTLILNHCPGYREKIEEMNKELGLNIKLILSGHTHGGQITFFGKELFKPDGSGRYLKGWYQNDATRMYVSKGIGTTILPIRFCARAEASIFHL
tara:strand:- start:15295 stop:16119 length:825 start_codon:yes stop_codon:yes gene_type:complete